ncbi:MAG TPA: 5'-3' exonuclease H3TH domain-containing protein [Candidatus Portnoybacteria bacterium]|jgi:DNA polymerase I|nr:5'-3' exonuclease H3TH domain-containing protein [Candidatus Portnoybacteria bacterium]MDD5752162.1 5'-3' exonuclease H3TH domain-containing protein [Candidatus Portnoybacteria bacterium]HNU96866.1 5'-3' exonuclease H3TH domain-containing protein [Candidatus Portnoybacteria bacterium]HOZ16442.1 5'-3' exonuclease H3TH domain-containing protein [Candidatus Portnoybacteria bacterium]HPH52126.1 5'-3' exonuclease H3TH domain-containing protein [Candidatus Portnoybacteria bacterium]
MKKLILIDGNAIVHRSFHALPPLTNRKGEMTNAVYGFSSVLIKVINELKPDYMVATFDLAAPTFRHIEYDQYKAKRVKAPDELYAQIPKTKDVLTAFGVPILEKEGFEADDIIGTVAKKYANKEIDILIITGDLDTLQLIDDNIRVYTMKKGLNDTIIYGEKEVEERYGLKVSQMIDYKALRGDSSDNIPGVKGIGEITATSLLKEFETLENLYKNVDKVKSKNVMEKLKKDKQMAFFSKRLGTIRLNVPIKISLKELDWQNHFDMEKIRALFEELGFHSLLRRLPGGEPPKRPEIKAKQQNLL